MTPVFTARTTLPAAAAAAKRRGIGAGVAGRRWPAWRVPRGIKSPADQYVALMQSVTAKTA